MVVWDVGHRLLGGVMYPLGGAQLLDQLLSILKLALEAPDHGVQEVVQGVPAVPAVHPRSNVALATVGHKAPPQAWLGVAKKFFLPVVFEM